MTPFKRITDISFLRKNKTKLNDNFLWRKTHRPLQTSTLLLLASNHLPFLTYLHVFFFSFYLRRSRTRSLKFHSQAYIFTARIPEIISFITISRSSVKEAAFSLRLAAFFANKTWNATRQKNIPAPERASQPTRYHKIRILITSSNGADNTMPIWFRDFSIFCASFDTRFIVFPDAVFTRL